MNDINWIKKRSAAFKFFCKNEKAAWKKIKRRILLLLSLSNIILHLSYYASRFYDKCHIFMTAIFCYVKKSTLFNFSFSSPS